MADIDDIKEAAKIRETLQRLTEMELDWDVLKAMEVGPDEVLLLQKVEKAAVEAKSAFSWIATEIENGADPKRLEEYARLNEARLADALDALREARNT